MAQPGTNILVTQTNPLSMGGGQVSAAAQPQVQQQPQMMAQQNAMPTQAPMAAQNSMSGAPVRGVAPTPAQLEVERQKNLMTIQQLKQTLEAAQQKDMQLKALVFSVFPFVRCACTLMAMGQH